MVKKLLVFAVTCLLATAAIAQPSKKEKKEQKRQKINALIRQEEEGTLIFRKQFAAGVYFKTNGYGINAELGRFKSRRLANLYQLDISETKHPKEFKDNSLIDNGLTITQGRGFVYGKQNSFYQVKLNYGLHYVLGSKGNKNGVAVSAIGTAGPVIGLLRPYYLKVNYGADPRYLSDVRSIKYDENDSLGAAYFLDPGRIVEGTGLSKGWGELIIRPGVNLKTAFRFDYGRYNEMLSAIEAGLHVEYYFQKVPILLQTKQRNLYFHAYVCVMLGKRKN